MIFCVFPNLGSTTASANDKSIIDLDYLYTYIRLSSDDNDAFQQSQWEQVYTNMAIGLSNQGYNVLVSTHKSVRDMLKYKNAKFITLFPTPSLKELWQVRLNHLKYSGTKPTKSITMLTNLVNNFDYIIDDLREDPCPYEIVSPNYNLKIVVQKALEKYK